MSFADDYRVLLQLLLDEEFSAEETNTRTGHRIRALRAGAAIQTDLSDGLLPMIDCRRTFPRTAAAEVAWFIRGEKSVRWLDRYAKIWKKFAEADGDTVESSYGYRWRRHFGRDQLGLAVATMRNDPSDRRTYVSAWDPSTDGLGALGQRNVPCPIGFTLSVVDGRLNSSLLIRSSDVFVGLPYDMMGHAMLMAIVAESLEDVVPGDLTVNIGHAHLYDSHYDMAKECLAQEPVRPEVRLVEMSLSGVEADPELLVADYSHRSKGTVHPSYSPVPEVVL